MDEVQILAEVSATLRHDGILSEFGYQAQAEEGAEFLPS
jgi:hypothetical protein